MFILNRRSAAGLLSLTLLAGCKDALGPGSVDVASLSSGVTAMTAAFESSASLQDMFALSQFFPAYSSVPGVRAALRVPASRQAFLARAAADRSLARSLSASPQALFPLAVLGKTLAWDTASHGYQINNTLGGAPVNGIRILVYTSNTLTSQPVLPLQQTGYLELTDESVAQGSTLGVLLTQGSSTVIDYAMTFATSVVASDTTFTIVSAGFIDDPAGPRVDFLFGDTVGQNQIVLAGRLTASDGSQVQSSVTEDSSSLGIFALVSKGGNSITLDVLATNVASNVAVTGVVRFNGVTVATVSGDPGAPTFTAANGHKLTSAESTGLQEIFGGAVLITYELTFFVLAPLFIVFRG